MKKGGFLKRIRMSSERLREFARYGSELSWRILVPISQTLPKVLKTKAKEKKGEQSRGCADMESFWPLRTRPFQGGEVLEAHEIKVPSPRGSFDPYHFSAPPPFRPFRQREQSTTSGPAVL